MSASLLPDTYHKQLTHWPSTSIMCHCTTKTTTAFHINHRQTGLVTS